jgi:hypothetical protein
MPEGMLHTLQFLDDALKLIHEIGRLHMKHACPTIRQSQKDLQVSTPAELLSIMHHSGLKQVGVQYHCIDASPIKDRHACTEKQMDMIAHLHGNRCPRAR